MIGDPRPQKRWALVIYRRIVRLYPSAFRQQYGADVELLVRDLADDPSISAWRLWIMLWRDLRHSVLREHVQNLTGARSILGSNALTLGAGGVAAIAGAVMIVASALPYVYFPNTELGIERFDWQAILYPRIPGSHWFAAEPVGLALLAIVAGIVLVVWTSPIPRAIASGALLAYGLQTVLLFGGYTYEAGHMTLAQLGPGGIVGILAGLLLLAGGLAPNFSVFARRSNPAMRRSRRGAVGGVIAMLAAPALIAAGALPYFYCKGAGICVEGAQSFSVFAGGLLYGPEMGTLLFGIEILAIVAGMVLALRVSGRIARAIASGIVLACGEQIVFLFGEYFAAGASVSYSGYRGELDSGAVVGMVAGLVLLVAGLVFTGTLIQRKQLRVT